MIVAGPYPLFLFALLMGAQFTLAAAAAADELSTLDQRIERAQAEIAALAQRLESARTGIEQSKAELARLNTAETSAAESMRTTREAFEAQSDAADRALAGLRADFDGARELAVKAAAPAPADGQAR